jgi:DDE superfamily endonuclease
MQKPENDIVYIDETSFHLWMSPGRLWIKQGMRVQLPDQRGQSITMIGALSIHQGLINTEAFAGSNTVDTFLPFIMRLKEKCKERPTIVVMDNLSVHHLKALKFQFDYHAFIAKYKAAL